MLQATSSETVLPNWRPGAAVVQIRGYKMSAFTRAPHHLIAMSRGIRSWLLANMINRFKTASVVDGSARSRSPGWSGSCYPSRIENLNAVDSESRCGCSSLLSFTSWVVDPDLSAGSCEASFGNGFTQTFTLLDPGPQVGAGGSLVKEDTAGRSTRMQQLGDGKDEVLSDEQEAQVPKPIGTRFECLYSETLRTSICEGTNMIMYPKRIDMSKGGEALDSVMGRKEEAELPSFMSGAFEVMVPETEERQALFNKSMLERLIPKGRVGVHTMHNLVEQIRTIPVDEVICAQRISAPTVIVTRVEYANLFHTITDWYNAYKASRITNLKKRPRLVFFDGHCEVAITCSGILPTLSIRNRGHRRVIELLSVN